MRKFSTLLFFFLIDSISLLAYDAEIDGIYYKFSGEEAIVTYREQYSKEDYTGDVVIPEYVTYEGNEYCVTEIGRNAFYNCSNMKSISIPASIIRIADWSFYGCTNLTAVKVPRSVRSIGYSAFAECENLVSVDISEGVEYIGRNAFEQTLWYNNQSDGLVYIGKVAYKYKGEMPEGTVIIIKEGTKGITEEAFRNCSGLSSISIPKSVNNIGYSLFTSCPRLTSIRIEQGNSVYDSRNDCNAIIEISTSILIAGCQNTTIPDDVVRIGDFSFTGCAALTSIAIPEGVKSVGFHAFEGCTELKSIVIPNSVAEIETSAFHYCCGLTSVTLGKGITSIESGAFEECQSLSSVVCYAENPPVCGGLAFVVGPRRKCTLYVPYNSIEAYKNANVWKSFTEIKNITEIGTAIASSLGESGEGCIIYDLQGRRMVNGLAKGIHIQNGKKISIK